ncbi:hypothetical protein [Microbacterium sp. zg.Y1084]|uniref:hypothetical protein n=1 Tax=Microbacterium sp. zg.Y1084 TaxID=2969667 RepID=UPI00214B6B63|nr:hypothetical protein [Microbacterium sp. zg.Y1084]MCR2812580.1 hypothetical protein [Microbacterium sp. zg.Y1084]
MADFRSERMASPEGEGRAKHALENAWDTYYVVNRAANKPLFAAFPWIKTMMRGQAASAAVDVFGFWLAWRLFGGFEGLQEHLGMSRSTIYRRIAAFRSVFGEHPDVYEFPGITVDVEAFYAGLTAQGGLKRDDS